MNAFKVELLIIDHDDIGSDGIVEELENGNYGNDCIHPEIMQITGRDIGEWSDDHILNYARTTRAEYDRLFGGRVLTCVYCGHEYPQDTPAAGSEVLTEHIKVCPKHPLRQAEATIARLREKIHLLAHRDAEIREQIHLLEHDAAEIRSLALALREL